jgi:hypothetical protein
MTIKNYAHKVYSQVYNQTNQYRSQTYWTVWQPINRKVLFQVYLRSQDRSFKEINQ